MGRFSKFFRMIKRGVEGESAPLPQDHQSSGVPTSNALKSSSRESGEPRCCFCLKPQKQVARLISSPQKSPPMSYICNECVPVANASAGIIDGGHLLRCSFCQKQQNQVAKLVLSGIDLKPRASICSDCIAVCLSILLDLNEPKRTPTEPKSESNGSRIARSKGVATITEAIAVSFRDLLGTATDQMIAEGVQQLRQEGREGTLALAALMDEMFTCRSRDIFIPIKAARGLDGAPELVNVLQAISSAPAQAPSPQAPRFGAELVGSGTVGWSDRTASYARKAALEALAILG